MSHLLCSHFLLSENELTVQPHVSLPSVTSVDSYITEMEKGRGTSKHLFTTGEQESSKYEYCNRCLVNLWREHRVSKWVRDEHTACCCSEQRLFHGAHSTREHMEKQTSKKAYKTESDARCPRWGDWDSQRHISPNHWSTTRCLMPFQWGLWWAMKRTQGFQCLRQKSCWWCGHKFRLESKGIRSILFPGNQSTGKSWQT